MTDNKFKTAAAKLLAQHSLTQQNFSTSKPAIPAKNPTPDLEPVKKIDSIWESDETETTPFFLKKATEVREVSASAKSSSFSFIKIMIVIVPAVLGCGIMLVLVPPTIFGIMGNIAVGLLGGGAFGAIIAKEL